MQATKITKGLMTMFFSNPILTPMQKHLSSKNVDKMKILLTELLYSKITW